MEVVVREPWSLYGRATRILVARTVNLRTANGQNGVHGVPAANARARRPEHDELQGRLSAVADAVRRVTPSKSRSAQEIAAMTPSVCGPIGLRSNPVL